MLRSSVRDLNPSNEVIKISSADLSCSDLQPPVMFDVNVRVLESNLTIIIGPVGSGKSVLLRAMLGEAHTKGSIRLAKTGVAYCAQEPWLCNSSVIHNIIGPYDFDNLWFRDVVQACALDYDFEKWPEGENTLVGSNGASLSGGQRQRVVSYKPSRMAQIHR